MKRIVFYLILFYCSILTLFPALAEDGKITLWITQDFSKRCLLVKEIPYSRQSVMNTLKENCDVKTTYGGSFVTSINNLEAIGKKEKKNWFYYVNGIMAHIGAPQYLPEPGDTIWWDFHAWDEAVYIPAVIGAYPQPFLNGYAGEMKKTLILHTASFAAKAVKLKDSLEKLGAQKINLKPCNDQAIKEQDSIFIIIGCWQDLSQYRAVQDMYRNYRKIGLFVKFEGAKLQIMDIDGKTRIEFDRASAIVATKGGVGLANTIWFIIGTDDDSVETAVDVLINEPGKIKFYSGAVITSGEILNVPLSTENQAYH